MITYRHRLIQITATKTTDDKTKSADQLDDTIAGVIYTRSTQHSGQLSVTRRVVQGSWNEAAGTVELTEVLCVLEFRSHCDHRLTYITEQSLLKCIPRDHV